MSNSPVPVPAGPSNLFSKLSKEGRVHVEEVFAYLKKFQDDVGLVLFKKAEEIYSVGWKKKYAEEESALHVIHTNGVRMSLIYCTWDDPKSVRVVFSLTVFHCGGDWENLGKHIVSCAEDEKKNPVKNTFFKSWHRAYVEE